MKRQHQIEFENVINSVISEKCSVNTILCKVTPGGGKSALPIITGKLIKHNIIDKILWVCPRMALQIQGERNFIDPFFRSMFTHNLSIRSSTNETDPCRGLQGFITTYQALAADAAGTVVNEVSRRRYAVILDEFHHLDIGGEWHRALDSVMNRAAFKVLMTGTLERGDQKKIAYIDYTDGGIANGLGDRPVLTGDQNTAVIQYDRSAALQDRAILPIHFVFSDGRSSWESARGNLINVASFYDVLPRERGAALYAALRTEFAEHLLAIGLNSYMRYRKRVADCRLLVVTANIQEATRHFTTLNENGYNVGIATSHDSPNALQAIEDFKAGAIDILVTIAIAYEGLDVPQISHLVCLTHIRSKPWIEQMFARAVRINPSAGSWGDQVAYVFAPDDVLMREIVDEIEREQIRHAMNTQYRKKILTSGDHKKPGIRPVGSAATSQREARLSPQPETPRQKEEALLRDIEGHIRRYAFANRLEPRDINTELVRGFGKSRRQMRYAELENLWEHIKRTYPMNGKTRGTGIPRVSTKAEIVDPKEFDDSFISIFDGLR